MNHKIVVLIIIMILSGCSHGKEGARFDWAVYLGDKSASHYSWLDEINTANVVRLEKVWEYHSGGDISGNHSQIQCNPLVIDGILYGTTPDLRLFALNAATGVPVWEFNPDPEKKHGMNVNRGVAFWNDGRDKRILFSAGPFLYAVNAETGMPAESFGNNGKVSLREGLGERAADLYVVATSPGIVYRDLIIIGSRVSENAGAAPGSIRAFNIRTGKLEWVFRTIPHPGEYGYETWPPEAYKTSGGANSWAGMTLDEKRGIVYVPTGSAAFDFWGGDRKGENLFANCILALDAATGKRIWHYQAVHHDLWDRDLPAPPNLFKKNHNGRSIDAVAQITKSGFVFVFDRETGEPLFDIEERNVPESDLEGEETWPTQPFPLQPPPFSPQTFTENEITNISPASYEYVKNILAGTRTGAQFIPPDLQGTVIFPGFDGGGEWGGAAVDPRTGIMYINSSVMPWILTMIKAMPDTGSYGMGSQAYRINCAVCHGTELQGDPAGTHPPLHDVRDKFSSEDLLKLINLGKGVMPSFRHLGDEEKAALVTFLTEKEDITVKYSDENSGMPYTFTGYNRFLDQEGYPAIKPPWGLLTAIDLNKGTIVWQVMLGEYRELIEKGLPPTGTENYGGPVVTAGGLIFIAASKDEYFRAFDARTGKELWRYKLPAGGYATPSVYEVFGKQYVVIACGGGKMGTKSGDSYVAFALPE
jgi:quinoprotein glucose dehydrogenase